MNVTWELAYFIEWDRAGLFRMMYMVMERLAANSGTARPLLLAEHEKETRRKADNNLTVY